ncbi:MAG: hypothetical protein WCX82_01220 [archaeon]|jgi:hypothetical protein
MPTIYRKINNAIAFKGKMEDRIGARVDRYSRDISNRTEANKERLVDRKSWRPSERIIDKKRFTTEHFILNTSIRNKGDIQKLHVDFLESKQKGTQGTISELKTLFENLNEYGKQNNCEYIDGITWIFAEYPLIAKRLGLTIDSKNLEVYNKIKRENGVLKVFGLDKNVLKTSWSSEKASAKLIKDRIDGKYADGDNDFDKDFDRTYGKSAVSAIKKGAGPLWGMALISESKAPGTSAIKGPTKLLVKSSYKVSKTSKLTINNTRNTTVSADPLQATKNKATLVIPMKCLVKTKDGGTEVKTLRLPKEMLPYFAMRIK